MLRVWGLDSAANAQKVFWCLGELGIPYEHVAAPAAPESARDRRYLALQGDVVPMIDDDGFVLFEGNAIARYLAETYGRAPFWPATAKGRADAGRWMDFQLSTLRGFLHQLMRGTPDRARTAELARALADGLEVVERALERSPYLAGDDFTVGDIPIGIMAYRWHALAIERRGMPAIEAWYARLRARPAFRQHVERRPPQGSFTPLEASGDRA
ncbi:MAG TPA: glutathione S-transferase family protein [Stellaceae bacterium]|nr:glutathione S-transferase family protein [Stellaceae bacterium]